LEERQAHLDLSTPCDLPLKAHGTCKTWARAKISFLLGVSFEEQPAVKACICHRCSHGSKNGWCLNPLHYYVGTLSENNLDARLDNPEVFLINDERIKSVQPKAVIAALSPEAQTKRKETFKRIKHSQGKRNSQWGTMWITDGAVSKKIKKGETIPDGFRLGKTIA